MCDNEETLMSIRESAEFPAFQQYGRAWRCWLPATMASMAEALQTVIPEDPNMPYDTAISSNRCQVEDFFEGASHFAKNVAGRGFGCLRLYLYTSVFVLFKKLFNHRDERLAVGKTCVYESFTDQLALF